MPELVPPGWTIPTGKDKGLTIPATNRALTAQLTQRVMWVYSNEGARNAGLSGLAPAERANAILESPGQWTRWNGTRWVSVLHFGSQINWNPILESTTSTQGTQQLLMGQGSLTGTYALHGERCDFDIVLRRGVGSQVGDGQWLFSLPVPAATYRQHVGMAFVQFKNSADDFYAAAHLISTTRMALTWTFTSKRVQTNNPAAVPAWSTTNDGDEIWIGGTYRAGAQ
ncbi:hypothetical protein PZ938_10150 [Luteipulveratus sp. YIM 133132]|uniref:hypothetical protein n=1 Tax=Luteipulveratus flavus TaxID=3031728 RepID=UPI0023AFE6D6|nr:hypothetical protein [Luteipulveratus sp. YIM 133132]MDE9365964.1 hypothetical protein [Luteipulveratus sp. YIM 133132]